MKATEQYFYAVLLLFQFAQVARESIFFFGRMPEIAFMASPINPSKLGQGGSHTFTSISGESVSPLYIGSQLLQL